MRGSAIVVAVVVIWAIPCAARTITVKANGTGDYATIQAAIDAAAHGDTVLVAPGTYTGDGNRDIDFKGKAITVRSEEGAQNCTIDCQGSRDKYHRGFYFHNGEHANSVVQGFTIIHGYASEGGGICNYSSPALINCTFSNNTARQGGGMYNRYGRSQVMNCTFSENKARNGGAIYNSMRSHPVMVNCNFNRNEAEENGGGMSNYKSDPTLTNCIFTDNAAGYNGGGIYNRVDSSPKLANSILWENRDWDGIDESAQIYITVRSAVVINYSCVVGWTGQLGGTGNIDADPSFVYPPTNDFHLLPGSPCINAGDPNYISDPGETDIDGDPRVLDGRIDIGIDEFTIPASPLIGVSQKTINFMAVEGGLNPQDQVLGVSNIGGGGILGWTASASESCPWLRVNPASGASSHEPVNVTLGVDMSGLGVGSYETVLALLAAGVANSPLSVVVNLRIRDKDRQLHVPSEHDTIQEAIDAAADGDTVILQRGRYTGDGNRDIDFKGKAITVRSVDPNDPNVVAATVIDGEVDDPHFRGEIHHGFVFHTGEKSNSVLAGVTITRFSSPDEMVMGGMGAVGGGILCRGSGPTVKRCVIKSNIAYYGSGVDWIGLGGGIYCDANSTARITHCTISGNEARLGAGGIHCDDSSCVVDHCVIVDNDSGWCTGGIECHGNSVVSDCIIANNRGGGILCRGNSVARRCLIKGNTSSGGVYAAGNAVVSYCTVIANSSQANSMVRPSRAGGIYCRDNAVIEHCVVAGNHSIYFPGDEYGGKIDGNGGGVYCGGGSPVIASCTIVGNIADDYGGGFYCSSSGSTLTNCILWGNASPNEPEISGDANVLYSNVKGGFQGQGNINADPHFADPNNADYHLKSQAGRWDPSSGSWVMDDVTSPCIDAGNPTSPIGYEPFPNGGIINMGAYGGTAEASKSHFGKPVCETILAGDINGDCSVDFKDFALMAYHWLENYSD